MDEHITQAVSIGNELIEWYTESITLVNLGNIMVSGLIQNIDQSMINKAYDMLKLYSDSEDTMETLIMWWARYTNYRISG